ncbi:MAG: ABC transporter permease [Myxococcaceae bacterium]
MNRSLVRLWITRMQQFFREPSAVFWTFGFPILLTIGLGLAFRNRPPEPVNAAVEDGPGAEVLRAQLALSPGVKASLLPADEAFTALSVGRVDLVVRPGTPVTYRFDPTRPESRMARLEVDGALQRAAGRGDKVATSDQHVTERGARYVDFLIPGLIGLTIMSSGMWGVAYIVVEERQKKLLKRMLATPMRRSEFLLSFVFLRLTFLALEVPVLLGFARLAYDIPLRGSLALVALIAVAGALAFTGVGMLLAARAKNTQTVNGLINLIQMPMLLLSGVFFSAARFPEVMQPIVKLLPLTALIDALRSVMNEGAGLMAVGPQVGYLLALAFVTFALALKLFRWT